MGISDARMPHPGQILPSVAKRVFFPPLRDSKYHPVSMHKRQAFLPSGLLLSQTSTVWQLAELSPSVLLVPLQSQMPSSTPTSPSRTEKSTAMEQSTFPVPLLKKKTAWLTRPYDWTLDPQIQPGFAARGGIVRSIAMCISNDFHWSLLYGTAPCVVPKR